MKKGFTLLEVLVASLLLGMLVTILTMIFNQSSIAWRTGLNSVADMDEVRSNIAQYREEADDLYPAIWTGGGNCKLLSPWDDSGNLRKRAWSVGDYASETADKVNVTVSSEGEVDDSSYILKDLSTGSTGSSDANRKSYTVNVKSAGPNRKFGTPREYDDIWSMPDEFEL